MPNAGIGGTDGSRAVTIDRTEANPLLPEDSRMTVETVAPDELEAEESTPGVVRETVFETENNVMVRSRVAPGKTTGWHHHGDRHVYGCVLKGSGAVEYGSDGGETAETSAGEFFYISPGTVHRDINPTSEDAVVLVNFVGSGPAVVNVDGPGAE
jgi:quercetin dioxygenase-like cupin family protein